MSRCNILFYHNMFRRVEVYNYHCKISYTFLPFFDKKDALILQLVKKLKKQKQKTQKKMKITLNKMYAYEEPSSGMLKVKIKYKKIQVKDCKLRIERKNIIKVTAIPK